MHCDFCLWFCAVFHMGAAFSACKEPELCECLWGCDVLNKDAPYSCRSPFLLYPNFGLYVTPQQFEHYVEIAKEKLEREVGKGYEGQWKTHVIKAKQADVSLMYFLLGLTLNSVKAEYKSRITARFVASGTTNKCDIAKCIAYCTSSCNSMCDNLEKTDRAYLEELSWNEDMCDVEKSKLSMKDLCTTYKDEGECDASCDGAVGIIFSSGAMIVLVLSWVHSAGHIF